MKPNATPPAAPPAPLRVTPWVPTSDPTKTRQRSWSALEEVRREIEQVTGEPPRLVVEPLTGMLLPRDQIVAAPSSPPQESHHRSDRQHLPLSYAILAELKEARMLRFFQTH